MNVWKYRLSSSVLWMDTLGPYMLTEGIRGCMGTIAAAFVGGSGYPSQTRPNLWHRRHCGFVSSHLTRLVLQVIHPLLTFGRLALALFALLNSPSGDVRLYNSIGVGCTGIRK